MAEVPSPVFAFTAARRRTRSSVDIGLPCSWRCCCRRQGVLVITFFQKDHDTKGGCICHDNNYRLLVIAPRLPSTSMPAALCVCSPPHYPRPRQSLSRDPPLVVQVFLPCEPFGDSRSS